MGALPVQWVPGQAEGHRGGRPASERGWNARAGWPGGVRIASLSALATHTSLPPQNRPSVITCASASARNCNLSHCPVAHSGCAAGPASYRRTPSCECPRVPPIPQQGGGLSTPYPPVPRTAASGPLRKAALSQHKGAGLGGGSSPWAPPSRPPSSQGGRRRRPVCMNHERVRTRPRAAGAETGPAPGSPSVRSPL